MLRNKCVTFEANILQAFLTDLWSNLYGNIHTSQHFHPIPATLNLYLSNQCTLQSQSKKKYNLYDLQFKKKKKENVFQKNSTLFR